MHLGHLSQYAFFLSPKSLQFDEEALQELIILACLLSELNGNFSLKQAEFLDGSDALHAIILLKLPLHLLVVL
jgi:hypothetical protein